VSRVAVIDVGSNSTRLFLCEGLGPDGPRGERTTTITALKRGAERDGSVTAEALGRLDACCRAYAEKIAAFAPDEIIPVGTSAVRDAPNWDLVDHIVASTVGAPLRVLTGADEAQLAYAGAYLAVEGDDPVIVMDIGGGSTELVRGDASGPTAAVSLDVGAVRLTDAYLTSDPPTPGEREAVIEAVSELAHPAIQGIGGTAPVVGVAGTMTTLAAVFLGEYDADRIHGMTLSIRDVTAITTDLAAVTLEERQRVPGLQPERAASIVAGALIACVVLDAAGVDSVAISERDLLDGVVLRLANSAR
jgi:exopolyphosphatase/guanosine-5'-triphosphate,3'-diphosphate pyrophosphatase